MEPDSCPHHHRLETHERTFVIDNEAFDRIARVLLYAYGLSDHELSWDFRNQTDMQQLNLEFRGKDRSTDVLSFPQYEWEEPLSFTRPETTDWTADAEDLDHLKPLGDIVISPEDALANAKDIGQALDREACFLFVHGFLHLCGHDHEVPAEEERMLEQQRLVMDFLERAGTHPLWTGCVQVEA